MKAKELVLVHFVIGMGLTGLGLWGIVTWWNIFGFVMRGVIPFFLLFLGLVAIIASCRRAEGEAEKPPLPGRDPVDDLLEPTTQVSQASGSPLQAG